MTNRFFLCLSLFLFLAGPIAAQSSMPRALLWEVTGDSLPLPSYVFGTFHVLCASDFAVDGVLQDKLSQVEQLYLELDFSDPQLPGQFMQHAVMKNDTTLSQFFTEEEFARISSAFQQATGQPLALLQRLKPLLFVSMILPSMLDCDLTGVEVALMDAIDTEQVAVRGLETVAQQMAIFDAIPYSMQAQQFEALLLKPDSVKQAMEALVSLYRSEDIDSILALAADDPSLSEFSDALLAARNIAWVPVMVDALQQKPTFFALGAAHLAGPTGVIHLLRQAGYTVEPVIR